MALSSTPTHIKLSGRAVPATFPAVRAASFSPPPPPVGGGITGGRPNDSGSLTGGGRPDDSGSITRGERPNDDGPITRGERPDDSGVVTWGRRFNDDGSIRRTTGGLRVGDLRRGEVDQGRLRVGDLRRGEVDQGRLRVGDLGRFPDLEFPDLRFPDLRFPDLKFPKLRIPTLRFPRLETPGGLHDGQDGKRTGTGKVNVRREPIYREIIFGVEPSGQRHLEIVWECDKWGRRIRTVQVWQAVANGREWTPETWDQYVREDGEIPPGVVYPQRGEADAETAALLTWNYETAPHSLGTEMGFDVPDPTGRVKRTNIITLAVSIGETEDHLYEADPGYTVYPSFSSAWLSPASS